MNPLENFEKLLANGQDSAMVRYTLGSLFCKQQRYDEALLHLRKAVELDPAYSAAWKLLGKTLLDAKHYAEARSALEAGLKVANLHGDQQVVREIQVFIKRLDRQQ